MPRKRQKPDYRSSSGAYATSPVTRRQADGSYRAHGDIQSWRGSTADLARAAAAGRDALGEQSQTVVTESVTTTDWHGEQIEYPTYDAFEESVGLTDLDVLSTVRFAFTDGSASGTIVARRTVPGVVITVEGPHNIVVDGLARLVFRHAMTGYVDRFGGVWRTVLAFAVTMVPLAITFAIYTGSKDAWPDWIRAICLVAGIIITFVVMVSFWPLLLVRTPVEFVPDDAVPSSAERDSVPARLAAFSRRRWVARGLGIIGILVIGVVTNKISDLIHWPN